MDQQTVFHIKKVEVIKCNHCMCNTTTKYQCFQYGENNDGKTSHV